MPRLHARTIVIAGGGTGGHLYPGIALAQAFEKRWQSKVCFVGTAHGIENRILPKRHYTFRTIWIRGLQRRLALGNLLFPVRLLASLLQSVYLILTLRPQLVVGTGGYVSGPVLMAALLMRVPTVIQEQNSFPGLVNRTLGKWVGQVHLTFNDSRRFFGDSERVFVSGNPVRADLAGGDKAAALETFGLSRGRTTALIFGGSQGAKAINSAVLGCLDRFMELPDLQLLWATGSSDYERVRIECKRLSGRISVRAYIEDMKSAYAAADFAIARSGASTLSELAACGLPAILVPFPYATAGHQEHNARSAAAVGAAIVIPQQELTTETLFKNVAELTKDPKRLEMMATASIDLARPDATEEIVTKIEQLLAKG